MAWRSRQKSIQEIERLKLQLGENLKRFEVVVSVLAVDWRETLDAMPLRLASSDNAARYEENARYFEAVLKGIKEVNRWLSEITAEPNKTKSPNPDTR